MAEGKHAHGSSTSASQEPTAARRHLVDDLFDGTIGEAPTAQVPLEPAEFKAAERPVDPPTERIDLLPGGPAMPFTLSEPSSEPLTLGVGAAPGPDFGVAAEPDLGLPVGSHPQPLALETAVPPPRPTPVTPRLPCTVLIAAEDRGAGAALAAGLMAEGYTCRAATMHELPEVARGPGVDAIVVRALDASPTWADTLRDFDGAVVALGTPPAARPGWGHAAASPAAVDLITAIESARAEALVHAAASEAEAPPATAPVARVMRPESLAGAGHSEVSAHVVRALYVGTDGRYARGQVRSISPAGQILVDLADPPRADQGVTVELIVADGRRAELPGAVTRSGQAQCLVALEVNPAQGEVLAQFVRETQDPSLPGVEQVRIRARRPESTPAAASPPLVDDEGLRRLFDEAAGALDDDPKQQAFIQACIKAERLPFAVQCYRELKADRPEDERVARYLNQVGTILGFYAFRKEDGARPDEGMPKTLKWALFAFVFAAIALWVIVEVLAG